MLEPVRSLQRYLMIIAVSGLVTNLGYFVLAAAREIEQSTLHLVTSSIGLLFAALYFFLVLRLRVWSGHDRYVIAIIQANIGWQLLKFGLSFGVAQDMGGFSLGAFLALAIVVGINLDLLQLLKQRWR
jgi:hypothetical protein